MFVKNDVVSFKYKQPLQGVSGRFGRVLSVRDTDEQKVRNEDYRSGDKEFKRSQLLVNVEHPNGDLRAYYIERTNSIFRYSKRLGAVCFGLRKFARKFV